MAPATCSVAVGEAAASGALSPGRPPAGASVAGTGDGARRRWGCSRGRLRRHSHEATERFSFVTAGRHCNENTSSTEASATRSMLLPRNQLWRRRAAFARHASNANAESSSSATTREEASGVAAHLGGRGGPPSDRPRGRGACAAQVSRTVLDGDLNLSARGVGQRCQGDDGRLPWGARQSGQLRLRRLRHRHRPVLWAERQVADLRW